ncbi:MAG TPA: hypothetical protein VGZ32_25435 [Actinocrinis sp.]|uniref:hypothetical protein n=1 Tax=Actinocrinis sp. TaxID=1920516 RepID=UPI002DDCD16A|nr:hypothetical protein [Actinocrinis sp.]HEV3173718.1 hypothetical protein [Actinocrinis sp.]
MPTDPRRSIAQRARASAPSALRSPAARALAAIGGAACALTVFALPSAAHAAGTTQPDRIIKHSFTFNPTPSFSLIFPSVPSTFVPSTPVGGQSSADNGHHKPSHSPTATSDGGVSGYVSTFSPVALVSTPNAASSVACVPSGQPVTAPGRGDLDLPGVGGTSTDPGHAGALTVSGVGPNSMLPPQIDSADLTELRITRTVDAASGNLTMVASSGYRFGCAYLEIGPGTGFSSAEYALAAAGLVADDRVGNTEILTVTYSSIQWAYTVPGSTTVHTGSGLINARPDKVSANLATDSRLIAEWTIGLTAIVALGLIVLYIAGRHRHRTRYRSRYYRRISARSRAVEYQPYQPFPPVEQNPQDVTPYQVPAEQQPELVGQVGLVEPVASSEPEPEKDPTADAVVAAVPETEREPEPEAEAEPDAAEAEPEAEVAPEAEQEPELEAESEAEPEPEAEPESATALELAQEAEAEGELSSDAEPETDAEPTDELDTEPEQKQEPEPAPTTEVEPAPSEPEPEAELEPAAEAESAPVAEAEAAPEPEPEPVSAAEPESAPAAEAEPATTPEPELAPEAEPEPEVEAAPAPAALEPEVEAAPAPVAVLAPEPEAVSEVEPVPAPVDDEGQEAPSAAQEPPRVASSSKT